MKKDRVFEMIHGFFKKIGWKYDFIEEEETFYSGLSMNGAIGSIRLVINVHNQYYKVYAILPAKADKEHLSIVAEYLHRANFDLNSGNFEFDYSDGEIRYKTFVEFRGVEFGEDVVEKSIIIPILMFDKYGKGILKSMLDSGIPEKLIEEAEELSDD